jgi:hypothetical protein
VRATRTEFWSPNLSVLASSVCAIAALTFALWLTRARPGDAWELSPALTITPERAAEGFIAAYRTRAFERAASFALGPLAHALHAGTLRPPPAAEGGDARLFVLQESHVLKHDKLRLLGVLVLPEQDESAGQPISVTVLRQAGRYWVVDFQFLDAPSATEPTP